MSQSSSPLATSYLRFLQLVKAVEGSPTQPSLDANESALLDALAVQWLADSPLTVMQAMGLSDLGSPATMHRRIARLRKMGLIATDEDANDTRIKRLVLTPVAVTHFEQLGQSLHTAVATT
ncbi:MAG: hypothetical protein QMB32_02165 [Burkholderiaceae bacterium]|jgi:DNA-binding transcriptional ArsR family regulator|tara:strand:- start:123 stop:485 length:363 start_codon:yes stop_codon:yes gene_type:complete